jgi:hypothetical protein
VFVDDFSRQKRWHMLQVSIIIYSDARLGLFNVQSSTFVIRRNYIENLEFKMDRLGGSV